MGPGPEKLDWAVPALIANTSIATTEKMRFFIFMIFFPPSFVSSEFDFFKSCNRVQENLQRATTITFFVRT
jgi:hypothetical protein